MTVTSATLSGPLLGQYLVYITPEFKNIKYKERVAFPQIAFRQVAFRQVA